METLKRSEQESETDTLGRPGWNPENQLGRIYKSECAKEALWFMDW